MFLDSPPVVLDGVQALRDADLLAFQILHPEDIVASPHCHTAAFVYPCRPQQHGSADVRVNMNWGIKTTEADQVVQIVYVVRVPVVLWCVAEIGVLDADLLELLTAPPQLLVDIVRGYHGAVGEPHLFPIQRYRAGFLDSFHHTFTSDIKLFHSYVP